MDFGVLSFSVLIRALNTLLLPSPRGPFDGLRAEDGPCEAFAQHGGGEHLKRRGVMVGFLQINSPFPLILSTRRLKECLLFCLFRSL
jgi:hypothetical protein